MPPVWHDLLANFALLVITVSVATHTHAPRAQWPQPWPKISLGLLFGAGCVALMMFPVTTPVSGVIFDLRSSLLALAAFFGGPVAGILAALIAGLFRFGIGGAGVTAGTIAIALSTAVGLIARRFVGNRPVRQLDVLTLAAYAGLTSIVSLLLLPPDIRTHAFEVCALPIVLLVTVSTGISGLAMRLEELRRVSFEENVTYRSIIEHLPDSLNVKDADGRFVAANPATARMVGARSPADLVGRTGHDFYPEDVARALEADERRAMAQAEPTVIEQNVRRPDGGPAWLWTLMVPLRTTRGEPFALITHNRDITEHKRLKAELAASHERLLDAISAISDGLAMFDRDGCLVLCNDQYRTMFPRTRELRVPGVSLREILRASAERGEQVDIDPGDIQPWVERTVAGLSVANEQEVQRFDGRWLHVRTTPMSDGSAMVLVSDITRVKQAEVELLALTQQLEILAATDGLTRLVNRRGFDEALTREIRRSARSRAPVSLLLADIDRFKAFNDRYGHLDGDDCLRRVANTLKETLRRPADIAARYGGEELVAILPDTDEKGALRVAEDYRAAVHDLRIPHAGSEKGVVTVSVGVATLASDEPLPSAHDLMARVDSALYAAKKAGRDTVRVWDGTSTRAAVA